MFVQNELLLCCCCCTGYFYIYRAVVTFVNGTVLGIPCGGIKDLPHISLTAEFVAEFYISYNSVNRFI